MPWEGFEPTIPVFEGVKTVHALDGAATVMDTRWFTQVKCTVGLPVTLVTTIYDGVLLFGEEKCYMNIEMNKQH
jgi:hypothetical protein